ncbi:hypothetical protein FC52_GL001275 [Lactobacillus pasteurii DSM 23907 = CRBIP 24.76]|uniref:RNA polymerase sigma factor, sigma-70 family n=1 Tax=Lactobacillus pasteurii DSM 23907 = CRBIP 24.76 TaxID=1423790 RepID=I7JZ45_9LACO|nr:sigma-70 family RNA polymerase sigma factor [Lactobacillus pasteurii]KRK07167.1 hypothetical protein FC52_GL001275 [Lactobacillus pasteurii DSM 23907 = CRBIP 24.76]TDG76948.1 hypothetical protein C5L33_001389 [Lactobacillus pasteurii]CCI86015.1 RNA polymerase sigma factor, sigma-70 family [Lactobacillus pasteurii DSM 23907 = CRBIP 24.76]
MKKISKKSFLKAWNNKKLVAVALKRAHVWPSCHYYDDLMQEGLIKYAEMIEQHSQLEESEVDRLSFMKVVWHTQDKLRQMQRKQEKETQDDELFNVLDHVDEEMAFILQDAILNLDELERKVLLNNILQGESLNQSAKEYSISKSQLYRLKDKLLAKLRKLLG